MGMLVYDVGMNNGDDTEYYLSQGANVVAIEANPVLVDMAKNRFRKEIDQERLYILNSGIADKEGKMEFWVNRELSEWSSFDKETAGRGGHDLESIVVNTLPLSDVINEYGLPEYLKIDIEGYDKHCLTSLYSTDKPKYVSVEFNHLSLLDTLKDIGYKYFKCICQFSHCSLDVRLKPPYLYFEALYNISVKNDDLTRALNSKIKKTNMWELTNVVLDSFKKDFAKGSSGPFGEDTDGVWMEYDEITDLYQAVSKRTQEQESAMPLWCDLHAKF